jgi:hypothetical protein
MPREKERTVLQVVDEVTAKLRLATIYAQDGALYTAALYTAEATEALLRVATARTRHAQNVLPMAAVTKKAARKKP